MGLEGVNNINFGYNHPLKTAFKKGLMPEVKFGIYKKPIGKKNVSIEHATPASQGGRLNLANVFLADRKANNDRGVKPFLEVVTKQMIIDYLRQFINVKNKFVDGMLYIKVVCKRFKINIKEVIGA